MQKDRREFLKRTAKIAAITTTMTALNATPLEKISHKKGKNEVLYFKSKAWEQFYKVAQ